MWKWIGTPVIDECNVYCALLNGSKMPLNRRLGICMARSTNVSHVTFDGMTSSIQVACEFEGYWD